MNSVPKLRTFNKVFVVVTAIFGISSIAHGDTVVRMIAVDANDAEEFINAGAQQGAMNLGSSDLEIASEGGLGLSWQAVGIQWDTLGIPRGSTINSATVTFTVDAAGGAGDNNLTIFTEAVDNSTVFTTTPFNITSRARSTATVAWAPAANNVIGSPVVTSDISAIIQEVVDRPGWQPDNLLTVMIIPDAYLALPDPSTGGSTMLQELELEAGPGPLSATLSVDFTPPPVLASFTYNDDLAGGTATWDLTFSEDVDGVTNDDFSLLTQLGPISGNPPTVLPGAKALGTSYVVTVTGITGTGLMSVVLTAGGSGIVNSSGTPLIVGGTSSALNNGVSLPTAGVVGLLLLAAALMCAAFVRSRRMESSNS